VSFVRVAAFQVVFWQLRAIAPKTCKPYAEFWSSALRVPVEKNKKKRWLWPLGVMATVITGAAVVVLRGCWHSKMSWPVSSQSHSYQVCLGCGIKRLFDEHNFRAYGPYSYDLNRLIAWQRSHDAKSNDARQATGEHLSAS